MQKLIPILSITFLTLSCGGEITKSDVDKLIKNQRDNNRLEIDRVQQDLEAYKIHDLKENIALVSDLHLVHDALDGAYDTIDHVDRIQAADVANHFIRKYFNKVYTNNRWVLPIDGDTPQPLAKLYLAKMEAFYIVDSKKRFYWKDEDAVKIDSFSVLIIPSTSVVNAGQPITGEIRIIANADFRGTKKLVKKMTLNGSEVKAGTNGWSFKITPTVNGSGLIPYEITAKAIWNDTSSFTGRTVIHIRK